MWSGSEGAASCRAAQPHVTMHLPHTSVTKARMNCSRVPSLSAKAEDWGARVDGHVGCSRADRAVPSSTETWSRMPTDQSSLHRKGR